MVVGERQLLSWRPSSWIICLRTEVWLLEKRKPALSYVELRLLLGLCLVIGALSLVALREWLL